MGKTIVARIVADYLVWRNTTFRAFDARRRNGSTTALPSGGNAEGARGVMVKARLGYPHVGPQDHRKKLHRRRRPAT
ncbi:MAG: hypothetical protein WDO73_13255 [Ignavibacteriota bacterium]